MRSFPGTDLRVGRSTVAWRIDGTWKRMNRGICERVRARIGRNPEPNAGIVDPQSVKTTRGWKRHL
jgi:hypothetical protein